MLKNMLPLNEIRGMKVKVYRNLHRKCLSVVHKGYVVAHVDTIALNDVEFKVSEVGRQRVLATKSKNVHAFVTGTVESINQPYSIDESQPIRYNPYERGEFYNPETGKPIHEASSATVSVKGVQVKEV